MAVSALSRMNVQFVEMRRYIKYYNSDEESRLGFVTAFTGENSSKEQ